MDYIKVCALGGLDEKGRDCYVIEINNDIFVLDCGTTLPDQNIPGVDFLIPNVDYLLNNKERIKAYIISHGHDESMSALKYFYHYAPAPVYCSSTTRTLLLGQADIQKIKIVKDIDFRIVDATCDINIAGHMVHFFQCCHNTSNSSGIAIETDQGNIVYTSDFIIDYSIKEKGYIFDIKAMSRLTKNPTLLLLAESKSANKPGYCSPKHKIHYKVLKYFKDEQKRIFIDCFWQNLYRIREICELAMQYNKKVYFYNEYTAKVMKLLMENEPDMLLPQYIVQNENLLRVPSQDLVILMLGHGEELYTELSLLSKGQNEDKRIILGPDDIFINAALATPTLEVAATRSVDSLYRTGCEVIWLKGKDLSSMHACQDDLKAFLSLLTPKYYMPVRGTFVQMMANAKLALSMGIGLNHTNVFVVDNGMQIVFDGVSRPKIIPKDYELSNRLFYKQYGDFIFGLTKDFDTKNLNVLRKGVKVGEYKNKILKYDNHYSRYINSFSNTFDLDDSDIEAYLNGDVIRKECEKGWVLLKYKGIPFSLAKSDGSIIKNHYPKYLRKK